MAEKDTTTSYQFAEGQPIRRIDVRAQSNGRAVAYLYADPSEESRTARQNIRAALRLKGWGTLSDHRDGAFALRVSGLRSGEELIAALQAEGLVSAPAQQQTVQAQETEKPTSLWGKIRSNSLQWSGIIATVGNVIGISRGIHTRQVKARIGGKEAKQWGEIGKGVAFMFSDLPMAIAGEHNDARQLTDFLHRLKKHYEKEGIEIPGTASINVETSDAGKSLGTRAVDFLHRYANQFKCGFESLAAVLNIKGGTPETLWPKRYAPYVWGTGFALSGLIQEKKIDEEKYAQAGTLSRLWMKIQAHPLFIGGMLGYTNNAADYYSAKIGYKEWDKAGRTGTPLWKWDVVTPTTMLGANGLYAMSNKTTGGDIKNNAMVSDAYTIAAQIINKQPEELREKTLESTVKFFGERIEIPEQRAMVEQRLRAEIDIQRQNPWFETQGLPSYVPAPKHRGAVRDAAALADTPLADAAPLNTIQASGIERVQTAPEHVLQH